jgi:hypothetical protein
VAANDSIDKTRADYICDGTDDDVQIQEAIDALGSTGGKVILLEGTFSVDADITGIPSSITICGQGIDATIIEVQSSSASKLIQNQYAISSGTNEHLTFRNLTLKGGSGGDYNHCFLLGNLNYLLLKNVRMENFDFPLRFIEKVKHIRLENVIFDGFRRGIFCNGKGTLSGDTADTAITGTVIDDMVLVNPIFCNESSSSRAMYNPLVLTSKSTTAADIQIYKNITLIGGYFIDFTDAVIDFANGDFENVELRDFIFDASAILSSSGMLISWAGDMYNLKIINGTWVDWKTHGSGNPLQIGYPGGASPYLGVPKFIHIRGNTFRNTAPGSTEAIVSLYARVERCMVECNIADADSSGIFCKEWDNSDHNIIRHNDLGACTITKLGSNTKVYKNKGHVTENSGTATLVNGTTSIAVNHGLDVTPAAGDIMVTPIEAWGAMTKFYIDTYTSTQFTIHADQDPGQDVDFAWKAIVL